MIGQSLGHYRIEDKLGEGGMGVVYKARDTHLDRFVAIKVLPPERVADPERKRRFVQEAKAASALNHPNIITIHDIAQEGGVDFMVMEYVAGKTLGELIGRKGLKLSETLRCGIQMADALAAAHGAGIVHRDLKPGNVMVTESGLVKVLDFGLAKLTEAMVGEEAPTQTAEGAILGTLAYLSPEQAEGKRVDARSDIFSFGSVLYEMVTGRRAFQGDSNLSILTAILRDQPRPARELAEEAPADLESIVARCLRKRAGERFETAIEVKLALEKLRAATLESGCTVPSIAVLPFVNMNRDEESEFFSDGLTEELINALAQLEGLRVVSRTSVFRFKGTSEDIREVGRKLQVTTALEGTVRRAGNRLRVTAQLINVADGYHLWSQRFDRELKDVFDVQDELARAIVGMLRVKLPGEEPRGLVKRYTANPQAHELCMKGRYYFYKFTREGFQKCIEYFEKARMEDPGCAPAYAGLAATYCGLAVFGWARPREAVPKGKQAALEALAIDPTDAAAHMALALIRHWYEWDWAGAESEYRRAIELSPGDPMSRGPYAELLAYMGRHEESIEQASRAVSLDPVSLEAHRMLSLTLFYARRYEEAADQCRRALELEPNFYPIHAILALVCGAQGRYQEARRAAEQARSLAPGEPLCEGLLGWALGATGERAQAMAILDEAMKRRREAYFPASMVSLIYLGLGDLDAACLWAETAFEERDPLLAAVAVSPLADPLLADSRFRELLRKIGLGN